MWLAFPADSAAHPFSRGMSHFTSSLQPITPMAISSVTTILHAQFNPWLSLTNRSARLVGHSKAVAPTTITGGMPSTGHLLVAEIAQDHTADLDHVPDASPPVGNKRPAPRGTAAYPRKRAVTACQQCRARRTKCDQRKPTCSFCLKVGAQCTQSSSDLSSFDPASLRILERLEDLDQLIRSTAAETKLSLTASATRPKTSSPRTQNNSIGRSQLLPPNVETVLSWPGFNEQQSLKYNIWAILRRPATNSPLNAFLTPHTITDLEPRTTKVLLDNFFQYCHVKNPVLVSEASIRQQVAHISLHGVDWSPQSCLALLVCAIGAISTPFGDSEMTMPGSPAYVTSQSYFQAAEKRLGSIVAIAGVVEAQCLFLAGVYSMYIFKPGAAWRFFRSSLASCEEFDFITHTAQTWEQTEAFEMQPNPPQLSTDEQAIYWSAWKSEQEMRQDLQHNDLFRSIEQPLYPQFFPTPPDPPQENNYDITDSQRERERTGWFFYLTEISLRRLACRISDEIDNIQSTSRQNMIQALADTHLLRVAQVEEWIRKLPDIMSLENPADEDDVCRFVIRGHLVNLWEMLYWPFVEAYLRSLEEFDRGDINCQELADSEPIIDKVIQKLAITGLQQHVQRIRVNKPGFKHRHHGTWPMVRTCSRSALILLKTAICLKQSHLSPRHVSRLDMPFGWEDTVAEVIELNRYWQCEAPDACFRAPILCNAWEMLN